jgi:hypothetical protein
MKPAVSHCHIWRCGAESFHRCKSSRFVIGTRHGDAHSPADMVDIDSAGVRRLTGA